MNYLRHNLLIRYLYKVMCASSLPQQQLQQPAQLTRVFHVFTATLPWCSLPKGLEQLLKYQGEGGGPYSQLYNCELPVLVQTTAVNLKIQYRINHLLHWQYDMTKYFHLPLALQNKLEYFTMSHSDSCKYCIYSTSKYPSPYLMYKLV